MDRCERDRRGRGRGSIADRLRTANNSAADAAINRECRRVNPAQKASSMTRRERLEAKLDKRHDWAASAERKATAAFNHSQNLVSGIPAGQPILVGHHSEGRHRRTLDRSWNALGKSVEMSKLAEHHEQKARGLEAALGKTIFSDDSDAVEAIEQRIAANEAKREEMKKINALYRKGNTAGLAELGVDIDELKAKLAALGNYFGQAPHMPFELTNLGARITADKKRLEHIKRMRKEQAEAEATETGVKIDNHANGYSSVRFAEKPDYSIIRALKDASFRWGSGCWFGQTANIPACVADLVGVADGV